MPIYAHDIDDILSNEEVRLLYDQAKTPAELVVISLLWILGPRPSEALEMTTDRVLITDDSVTFIIPTKKLHNDGQTFVMKNRTIRILRSKDNPYLETIVKYVSRLKPGDKLLDYGRSWMEKKINQMGIRTLNKQISPYHFRHSASTREASQGRTLDQLMHFKGAKNINSVKNYVHARPYDVDMSLGYGIGAEHCSSCKKQARLLSTGECEQCFTSRLTAPTQKEDKRDSPGTT